MKERYKTYYFPGGNDFSPSDFSERLISFVRDFFKKNDPCPILFLCIGSDRITGDSLGPLIGYKLEQRLLDPAAAGCVPYQVLGTLSRPVHALNLRSTLGSLSRIKAPYLTIAVDAAVGSLDSVGSITLSNRPLTPGEGVNHALPSVGQISVTGIISDENSKLPFHLQNIRLYAVMQLAECIYQGLLTFLYSYSSQLPAPAEVPDFPHRMFQDLSASACSSCPYPDDSHKNL